MVGYPQSEGHGVENGLFALLDETCAERPFSLEKRQHKKQGESAPPPLQIPEFEFGAG